MSTSPTTRISVGPVLAAATALTFASILGAPVAVVAAIAALVVARVSLRTGVEHGLRAASIGFFPVLVALEHGTTAATRPRGLELLGWGVFLIVGAFAASRHHTGGIPAPRRVQYASMQRSDEVRDLGASDALTGAPTLTDTDEFAEAA